MATKAPKTARKPISDEQRKLNKEQGERLRQARIAARFKTATALAARAGIPLSTYAAAENGQSGVSEKVAFAVAPYIKVPPQPTKRRFGSRQPRCEVQNQGEGLPRLASQDRQRPANLRIVGPADLHRSRSRSHSAISSVIRWLLLGEPGLLRAQGDQSPENEGWSLPLLFGAAEAHGQSCRAAAHDLDRYFSTAFAAPPAGHQLRSFGLLFRFIPAIPTVRSDPRPPRLVPRGEAKKGELGCHFGP